MEYSSVAQKCQIPLRVRDPYAAATAATAIAAPSPPVAAIASRSFCRQAIEQHANCITMDG